VSTDVTKPFDEVPGGAAEGDGRSVASGEGGADRCGVVDELDAGVGSDPVAGPFSDFSSRGWVGLLPGTVLGGVGVAPKTPALKIPAAIQLTSATAARPSRGPVNPVKQGPQVCFGEVIGSPTSSHRGLASPPGGGLADVGARC
jgi:hypothetical protein